MSDFTSSLPIRTENNGDVKIILVDSSNPSLGATVDSSGALKTNVTFSGPVTANQGSPNTNGNGWPVKITDGVNGDVAVKAPSIPANASDPSLVVGLSPNSPLPTGTNQIGHVIVDSSALVYQPTGSQLHVQIDAGTSNIGKVAILDSSGNVITVTNPLPVFVSAKVPGTEINDYNTVVAIATNGTSNHDYTITVGKTFIGKKFWATASGKLKVEVQVSPDGVTFSSKWVGFNSTATPNINIDLDVFSISDSGAGSKIRIIRTNLDKTAMDVYSTISGTEQ